MKLPSVLLMMMVASMVLADAPKVQPDVAPDASVAKTGPSKLDTTEALRARLIGKWMGRDGDQWDFTEAGGCIRVVEAAKAEEMGRAIKEQGTFAMLEGARLEVKFDGRPVEVFQVVNEAGQWTFQPREGKAFALAPLGKKEMAALILEDLRLVEAAQDQWAIENRQPKGVMVLTADLQVYIKHGIRVFYLLGNPAGPRDLLGNPLGPLMIGKTPKVPRATQKYLSDVAPPAFWGASAN